MLLQFSRRRCCQRHVAILCERHGAISSERYYSARGAVALRRNERQYGLALTEWSECYSASRCKCYGAKCTGAIKNGGPFRASPYLLHSHMIITKVMRTTTVAVKKSHILGPLIQSSWSGLRGSCLPLSVATSWSSPLRSSRLHRSHRVPTILTSSSLPPPSVD